MNDMERRRRKYKSQRLVRNLLVFVALVAIVFFINKDVSDRAYNYAKIRPPSWIETPTIVDRLCFRRFVWIAKDNFKVNIFGVEKVHRRDPTARPMTLIKDVEDENVLKARDVRESTWLHGQPAQHYTLYFGKSKDLGYLESFVADTRLDRDEIHFVPVSSEGDQGYYLLLGNFDSMSAAETAMAELPELAQQFDSGIHCFAEFQKQLH